MTRCFNLVLISLILIYHVKTSKALDKDYNKKKESSPDNSLNNYQDNLSNDKDPSYNNSKKKDENKKSLIIKNTKKTNIEEHLNQQIKDKVTQDNNLNKEKCGNIIKHFNSCPEFKNCIYYQVSQNYANMGCSVCNKDYELIEDEEGSGYCVPVSKKSVKNCQINAVSVIYGYGQPICYKCEEGFVLDYEMKSCTPGHITKCTKIDNCQAYSEMNDSSKTVICDICRPGYTLSQDKTECLNGCRIENCQTCAVVNGENKCRICNVGTIGVFDPKSIVYSECMTCNTWSCKLLTKKGQECCLKQKF
jgi:hypothetical protein